MDFCELNTKGDRDKILNRKMYLSEPKLVVEKAYLTADFSCEFSVKLVDF